MPSAHGRTHYNPAAGLPGKVTYNTIYVQVKEMPDGTTLVWWKGTGEDSRNMVKQWEEDGDLAAGLRSKTLDRDLDWVLSHYGYQSDTVKHAGFSRGGAPARLCGGIGYGSANFAAYPPRDGSTKVDSEYDQGGLWNHFSAWFHNSIVDPVSDALVKFENATGLHSAAYKGPQSSSQNMSRGGALAVAMSKGTKRSPISVLEGPTPKMSRGSRATRSLDFGHPITSPDPKRRKPNPRDPTNPIQGGGDFSGLVSTFLDPVTGRILGYKGIPRKQRFSALQDTSDFWRRQMALDAQISVAS